MADRDAYLRQQAEPPFQADLGPQLGDVYQGPVWERDHRWTPERGLWQALKGTARDALGMTPYGAGELIGQGIMEPSAHSAWQIPLGILGMVPGGVGNKLARGSRYDRIPGTPETFKLPGGETLEAKPIPGIVDAAHDYARKTGIRMEMPREFPKFDKERAGNIAKTFDAAGHNPQDPKVKRSADALIRETKAQYDALADQGYKFKFMQTDPKTGEIIDPYAASPALGYKDLAENKTLEIFPTETGGFGSSSFDPSTNPLLGRSGVDWDGQPTTYNDLFRAVHDAYGHFGHGNPFFRAPGEERAWQLHAGMFSPEARKLMTTETRGQNSWVNYGPYGDQNRTASGADTVYADQKTTILPDWVMNDGRPAPIVDQAPFVPVGPFAGDVEYGQ